MRYHLQSYFLAIGPRAFDSEAWQAFWARVRPVPSKQWVIKRYEVGLSQALLRAGLRLQALWPYVGLMGQTAVDELPRNAIADETEAAALSLGESAKADPMALARRIQATRIHAAAAERAPLNPTNDLWRQLLAAGFPFIKRELLRDNPSGVRDLADWRSTVERELQADTSAIEIDLQRVLRNRAP